MREYTKKQMHKILSESAIYVDLGLVNGFEGSYRIDYVPEWDLWATGEDSIILTDEETGETHYFYIEDIDLNDPDIITYKLVQSNIDGYENY